MERGLVIRPARDTKLPKAEAKLLDRIEMLEDILHVLVMGLNAVHANDNLSGGARMMLASMGRAALSKSQEA